MAGSLTIHYGLMGSGKTLFAMADVVLPAVKAGRPFFTNITGINLSAISWLTGVHTTMIKYYPVQTIQDVIGYFDNNSISHDGVFVLDEMKDFIDDDKAVSWLESRINITRKMGVDFLFIAQQAKKQYIHPDLLGLCDTCNYFATRKQKGDTSSVDEYFIQGGDPKVVNKVPLVYDGIKRRKKDERVFLTYSTSDSKYYNAQEDNTYKGLLWYQTRKWKLIFVLMGVVFFGLVSVVFILKTLFSSVHELNAKPGEVGDGQTIQNTIERSVERSSVVSNLPDCFQWKICADGICRTDIGTFQAINEIDSRLCTPGGLCYDKCQGDNVFSSGGGLLRTRGEVPKGEGGSLRNK